MSLDEGDSLTAVVRVPKEEEEANSEAENQAPTGEGPAASEGSDPPEQITPENNELIDEADGAVENPPESGESSDDSTEDES